jgi:hypothetical protein
MSEQRYPSDVIDRAEALVSRIQGISSCRISTDEVGEITEVHVVATSHKPPKLVARDVEGCLKAMLGIHVDHRKIGVVVFDAVEDEEQCEQETRAIHDNPVPDGEEEERIEEFPVEEFPARFEFQSVNIFISQESIQAEVELVRDGLEVLGNAATAHLSLSPARVVAEATLKAVGELLQESNRLCLADVQEVQLGEEIAIVVKVDLLRNRDVKSLAGCALFSGNINQTVVYATLDAVNRIVGKLGIQKSIEYRIK